MKKKIGLIIDGDIYKRVKLYCVKNEVGISELFEYVIEAYIDRIESIEKEIERRRLTIEDNYIENIKQGFDVKEIGPKK